MKNVVIIIFSNDSTTFFVPFSLSGAPAFDVAKVFPTIFKSNIAEESRVCLSRLLLCSKQLNPMIEFSRLLRKFRNGGSSPPCFLETVARDETRDVECRAGRCLGVCASGSIHTIN